MQKREPQSIQKQIDALPSGGITYKKIAGKRYAYYQWREGGKQRARRVKDDELEGLRAQIEQRKALQAQLSHAASLNEGRGSSIGGAVSSPDSFSLLVRMGEQLRAFAAPVASWRKRDCFDALSNYVHGNTDGRVFVLYGLRRSGKTTLIRQVLAAMDEADLMRSAFAQLREGDTLAEVNADLKTLESLGVKYVFIDEVTLAADFIEGAALLSDLYATAGMKIVLTGTDSLGFLLAEDEELFDRCIMAHTTFIPYREFNRVLGISGIDAYIEYGGTMSVSGVNYNAEGVFANARRVGEYVDSAIARNIQHSLRNYQGGGHFRSLAELYEGGELTNAINRVVEDMNHRFTLEVLSRDFKSHDLGVSAANLRKDAAHPQDVLDRVDVASVTARLKQLLEIKDAQERSISLTQAHVDEIDEYLRLLDVVADVDVVNAANAGSVGRRVVVSQPGLRYAQAKALIASLLEDEAFLSLSALERKYVTDRILDEVRGRMMEDIVMLETKLAYPARRVFSLQFAVGEFDMVVVDPKSVSCWLYEVKHSSKRVCAQRRHLLDEEKCALAERRFGAIQGKAVIYRGEAACEDGIEYLNVEDYLARL